ncbi:MAG: hypothetical protein HY043_23445 [Verrucomicrobia bacterium]|nr:hypothetical protein [Verrucomicrobiota bacterium]
MAKNDFVPNGDGDFLDWHDQLLSAANTVGPGVGMTPADLATLAADNASLHTPTAAVSPVDKAAPQAANTKQTARRDAEKHARLIAKRAKLDPNYLAATGEQLGIEGPEDSTDMTQAKPKLSLTALPHGCAEIGFNKLKADGVRIYGQREAETDWLFLARENFSPYIDNRPLLVAGKPELRRYKAIFVVGRDEIGLESDVVEIACRP